MRRFGALVAIIVLTSGCAQSGAATTGSAPLSPIAVPTASPSTAAATAGNTPISSVLTISARPASNPQADGSISRQLIGLAGGQMAPVGSAVSLGEGTDPFDTQSVAPALGAQPIFTWYSSSTDTTTVLASNASSFGLNQHALISLVPTTSSQVSVPFTALQLGDLVYVQGGDYVLSATGGAAVQAFALPVLKPDPVAGKTPPGYTGLWNGVGVGTVSALVPTPDGDVVAVTFTGRAAAVTRLKDGATRTLDGYSRTGAGALTAAGLLVTLAWSGVDKSRTIHVVAIDPGTLEIVADVDTGLPATGHLRDRVLSGFGHDAVIGVSHGDDEVGIELDVWTLDGGTLHPGPKLPIAVGLEIAPAGPSSLYIYDGPARNTVSDLDLSTGALSPDIPGLRSPIGSYLVGLLPG